MGVDTIIGAAAVAAGAFLLIKAKSLAEIPRKLQIFCGRHPGLPKLIRHQRFFEIDKVVRFVTVFWRVCGAIWILGGISLILKLGSIEASLGKR